MAILNISAVAAESERVGVAPSEPTNCSNITDNVECNLAFPKCEWNYGSQTCNKTPSCSNITDHIKCDNSFPLCEFNYDSGICNKSTWKYTPPPSCTEINDKTKGSYGWDCNLMNGAGTNSTVTNPYKLDCVWNFHGDKSKLPFPLSQQSCEAFTNCTAIGLDSSCFDKYATHGCVWSVGDIGDGKCVRAKDVTCDQISTLGLDSSVPSCSKITAKDGQCGVGKSVYQCGPTIHTDCFGLTYSECIQATTKTFGGKCSWRTDLGPEAKCWPQQ